MGDVSFGYAQSMDRFAVVISSVADTPEQAFTMFANLMDSDYGVLLNAGDNLQLIQNQWAAIFFHNLHRYANDLFHAVAAGFCTQRCWALNFVKSAAVTYIEDTTLLMQLWDMFLLDRNRFAHDFFFIRVAIVMVMMNKNTFLQIEDDVRRDEAFAAFFESGNTIEVDARVLLHKLSHEVTTLSTTIPSSSSSSSSCFGRYSEEDMADPAFIDRFVRDIIAADTATTSDDADAQYAVAAAAAKNSPVGKTFS